MVTDSLKIRKDLREDDSALRLALSFFQPLHLFLEILVTHVVRLLLQGDCLSEHFRHIA